MLRYIRPSGLALAVAAVLTARATIALSGPATELPAGGLVFSTHNALEVEQLDVEIGLDHVRATYVVRNTEEKPLTVGMAFPMPDIDMASLAGAGVVVPSFDPANPTNFVGFWTLIDEKPVEPDVQQKALALGVVDVTNTLNDLKIPLYPFDPGMSAALLALTPEQRDGLAADSVLISAEAPGEPKWLLRTAFHWRVAFAAKQLVTIRHAYKPVAGNAPWSAERAAYWQKKYCLTDEQVANLNKRAADGKPPTVYWVHYDHVSTAHLKGPAGIFRLTLDRPSETGIAATCKSGLVPAGTMRLQWLASDYSDDEDIQAFFAE